jgi:predicted aconitase with swiveling domain
MTMSSGSPRRGHPIVAGEADGTALVVRQPLSLAGGMSLSTGRVIDVHAPQYGDMLAGRILVMPVGRGSSTTSTVLAEAIRLGTGPAAIVLRDADEILALGAIVARTLYGRTCPILRTEPADFEAIRTGDRISIKRDGTFTIEPPAAASGSA